MAFTILARVGEDNPKSIIATTITAYAMSSIVTGAVFFAMGSCRLGSFIGFFPRHILVGCIGGVGWFLVVTGLEVSTRLDGNLEYNYTTLQKLTSTDTLAHWMIPLALAIVLMIVKRWAKSQYTDAAYFLSIIAIFYFFVAAIPELNLPELRNKGWAFETPEAEVPFYHFYSLYGKVTKPCITVTLICVRLFFDQLGRPSRHDTCSTCSDLLQCTPCSYKHSCSRFVSRCE